MKRIRFSGTVVNPVRGGLFLAAAALALLAPRAAGWELWGCGNNQRGELCDGAASYYYAPARMRGDVRSVAVGYSHSLYIDALGDLYACGVNDSGSFGSAGPALSIAPVLVAHNVAQAACGIGFSIFLTTDGNVFTCGINSVGQLATGDTASHSQPVWVATHAKAVAAGDAYCLYLGEDDVLYGSGRNADEQLGGPDPVDVSTWKIVATNVARMVAGDSTTLYLTRDGVLYGLGYNYYDQLGVATPLIYTTALVTIATDVRDFCASGHAVFFVTTGNRLYGLGGNNSNYYGGDTTVHEGPVLMMEDVLSVSSGCGASHVLVVKTDHSLWAVGNNSDYQLGRTGGTVFTTWQKVDDNVVAATAAWNRSLYFKATGASCYEPRDEKKLKEIPLGWVDDTYFPWVWSYTLGLWYYVYDGICAEADGYWIFYYSPDFSSYGWGYFFPTLGWWSLSQEGNARWVYYGEPLPVE
jgi:alpha-tubulin suppressor-like RCC1 family protein